MNTYTLGNISYPAILTVEEGCIRRAIILFAEMLGAGVSTKEIYSEDYAVVEFFKSPGDSPRATVRVEDYTDESCPVAEYFRNGKSGFMVRDLESIKLYERKSPPPSLII